MWVSNYFRKMRQHIARAFQIAGYNDLWFKKFNWPVAAVCAIKIPFQPQNNRFHEKIKEKTCNYP